MRLCRTPRGRPAPPSPRSRPRQPRGPPAQAQARSDRSSTASHPPTSRWLHADLTRDAGAPSGRRDGPALRRTAAARARHRLAGVRLAAAPRLQRRRPRRDAGDAGHRPLDEVVRRTPAAAARHPRQRPRRDPDAARSCGAGRGATTTRSRRTTRASAPSGGTATSRTPSATWPACAPTSAAPPHRQPDLTGPGPRRSGCLGCRHEPGVPRLRVTAPGSPSSPPSPCWRSRRAGGRRSS